MAFERETVVRGKRLEVVGPWPDIPAIGIAKDLGYRRVTAGKSHNFGIRLNLHHAKSLTSLDF